MSELMLDGAACRIDLGPFAPGRLPILDPERLGHIETGAPTHSNT
jgi:hypothetical protein